MFAQYRTSRSLKLPAEFSHLVAVTHIKIVAQVTLKLFEYEKKFSTVVLDAKIGFLNCINKGD